MPYGLTVRSPCDDVRSYLQIHSDVDSLFEKAVSRTAFKNHHKDEGTTERLTRARVAIIGSGVGGGFAAYFLREFGPELDIHMWRKKGSKVGGRTAVVEFDGHVYESGASVIHTSNKYLVDLAKKFGKFCQLVKINH